MSTMTVSKSSLSLKATVKCVNFVVGEIFRLFLILLDQRGLNNGNLLDKKEIIFNGLITFLSTRTLKLIHLEIYADNNSPDALERWDFPVDYATPEVSDENVMEETNVEKLNNILSRISALPRKAEYRILVSLSPGAPAVSGWNDAQLKNISDLTRLSEGKIIGTSRISAGIDYWGNANIKGGK